MERQLMKQQPMKHLPPPILQIRLQQTQVLVQLQQLQLILHQQQQKVLITLSLVAKNLLHQTGCLVTLLQQHQMHPAAFKVVLKINGCKKRLTTIETWHPLEIFMNQKHLLAATTLLGSQMNRVGKIVENGGQCSHWHGSRWHLQPMK